MKTPHPWLPTRETLEKNRRLRWLLPFLGHPRLWHWSRRGVAMGVALGVFFGLLVPIAQIPLSAAAAILLRANVPAAVASTLVTNPVTFGPVYYGAYRLGLWLTGEAAPPGPGIAKPASPGTATGIWSRLTRLGKPLLLGLSILASVTGLLTYAVITLVWRWQILAKRRRRVRR
ncbi:MAG: DUF2062 domain-containing protein [Gallionellaceae bacterium]|nr:DUF2062 domain-containing protein [Gallionellaceae bacterium]MDD5366371.1 DUF2062 domain-containing protein [Gallionellaceae bacterium]